MEYRLCRLVRELDKSRTIIVSYVPNEMALVGNVLTNSNMSGNWLIMNLLSDKTRTEDKIPSGSKHHKDWSLV